MTRGSERSGVTVADGFRAAGVSAGIRKAGTPDLALIVSDHPATAAAVFTRNLVQAAPVVYSKEALERSGGRARAIVTNSGNANACTGPAGYSAVRRTVAETARILDLHPDNVLVASTGVIGVQLPVDQLCSALPTAAARLSVEGGRIAAEAILTTDTCVKEAVREISDAGVEYSIGGMAKGSGMIHPDMATTLVFVTTDAAIEASLLGAALRRAVDRSFNCVTVDGDTSTNDMAAVLANGASGAVIGENATLEKFEAALTEVLVDLARAVARDGEGATKLITVRVTGARSETDASRVARTIASSPLVKTAIYGADANWGRIVAAAGRAGVHIEPDRVAVRINELAVLEPGYLSSFSEREVAAALAGTEVEITVDLDLGEVNGTAWTCDLTAEYIAINAHYRT